MSFKPAPLAMIAALGLLVGCAPELEVEDAQAAWGATQRTLHGGTAADASSSSVQIGGDLSSFTFSCAEGGKARFSFDLGSSFTSAFDGDLEMKWDVKFQGCQVDGVKVKGNLEFGLFADVDHEGFNSKWWYKGKLNYRGDVQGSCVIDMNGYFVADMLSAKAAYEGSICGHDAAAALSTDFGMLDDLDDFDDEDWDF